MKIWSVFSLVIVFHVAIIGLLLVQPGCQSQPADKPDPGMTAPTTAEPYTEPDQLDDAFNAGIAPQSSAVASNRNLSSPTRPKGSTRTTPDTGVLTPVLEPVLDDVSVPSAQSEYTVQKGDTLSGISRREGVSLNELLSANGLNRSSVIYVGQVLMIPSSGGTDSVTSIEMTTSSKEIVVASGDTLSAIAQRTGTSVATLKALNGLTSDTIFVGQRLAVPDSGTSQPAPAPSRTTSVTTSAPVVSGQSGYTVQSGDTPSGIARKFGVSTPALMAANNITDPRKLYVGQKLVIPGTSGSTAPVQPVPPRSENPVPSPVEPEESIPEPRVEDPMSVLENLEDEDLPYIEVEQVEVVEEASQPGN